MALGGVETWRGAVSGSDEAAWDAGAPSVWPDVSAFGRGLWSVLAFPPRMAGSLSLTFLEALWIDSVGPPSCGFVPAPRASLSLLIGTRQEGVARCPGTRMTFWKTSRFCSAQTCWPGGLCAQGQEYSRIHNAVPRDPQVPSFYLLARGPPLALSIWIVLHDA